MTDGLQGTAISRPADAREGELTTRIEHFTSQVPSGTYLSLAIGSIGLRAAANRATQKIHATCMPLLSTSG